MFCRNHLKNTSCDVGFLNKYYYHQICLSIEWEYYTHVEILTGNS